MTTKTKPRPKATQFPGEWAEQRQYETARDSSPLVLPKPQRRLIHPPSPGKRADGRLWFDGETRRATAGDKVTLAQMSRQRLKLDGTELQSRDVRKGDKWLPWHFKRGDE